MFVLADIMEAATATGTGIYADMWDEETRRRALELDDALDGFNAFEKVDWTTSVSQRMILNKPSTLTEQLDRLRGAGFADVDVHWMMGAMPSSAAGAEPSRNTYALNHYNRKTFFYTHWKS